MSLSVAESYLDPFVCVSVYDRAGKLVEGPQSTPIALEKKPTYVQIAAIVHVQTS